MTSEQFDALVVLMGQPDSKSAAAARLVLVEGLSSAEAARRVGITTQGANQAVQRCPLIRASTSRAWRMLQ